MSQPTHRYFAIHKPFNMVSQFISPDRVNLLGQLDFDFPEGTHAIGRLDNASEGLLLLTTNKKVTRLLFQGEVPHTRTYLVLVKNIVAPETVTALSQGVPISAEGGSTWLTSPCTVSITTPPADLKLEALPQFARADIPQTWLSITLTEGRFHQVRKMVFAMGHRCKRLIRTSIEQIELGDLPPGGVREYEEETFFRLLNIQDWRD
jgi:23S rRNA pseudouridine2457 synthase